MTTTTLNNTFQHHADSQVLSPNRLWTLFSLWYERAHQRHQLSNLSVEQLKDIGATRNSAIAEVVKPFWQG